MMMQMDDQERSKYTSCNRDFSILRIVNEIDGQFLSMGVHIMGVIVNQVWAAMARRMIVGNPQVLW